MFVFFEDKHSPKRAEQKQPTWGNPKAPLSKKTPADRQTLLNGILPMEQERKQSPYRAMEYRPRYDWGSNSPWSPRTPGFNPDADSKRYGSQLPGRVDTFLKNTSTARRTTQGQPVSEQAKGGLLTGPLTGHAAASLNPDGSI